MSPPVYKEALLRDNKLKWKQDMQSKMNLLHKNAIWDLVHLPTGKKVVPCKCIYKLKVIDIQNNPKVSCKRFQAITKD